MTDQLGRNGEFERVGSDGAFRRVKPVAGTEVVVVVKQNGVVKDWVPDGFDPDVTTHLVVDPTAQPYQAGKVYQIYAPGTLDNPDNAFSMVRSTLNPALKFQTESAAYATTGPTEPVWANHVDDGDAQWNEYTLSSWTGLTGSASPKRVIGDGSVFLVTGNGSTGLTEPDWTTAPNWHDTLLDGTVTWQRQGPATTWAALTKVYVGIAPSRDQQFSPFVVPTTPNGKIYELNSNVARKPFLAAGTEPAWQGDTPGGGLLWSDGEIIWGEYTSGPEQLWLSGLAAASSRRVLSVILMPISDDSSNVGITTKAQASDWPEWAQSEPANAIFGPDNAAPSSMGAAFQLLYEPDLARWVPLGT